VPHHTTFGFWLRYTLLDTLPVSYLHTCTACRVHAGHTLPLRYRCGSTRHLHRLRFYVRLPLRFCWFHAVSSAFSRTAAPGVTRTRCTRLPAGSHHAAHCRCCGYRITAAHAPLVCGSGYAPRSAHRRTFSGLRGSAAAAPSLHRFTAPGLYTVRSFRTDWFSAIHWFTVHYIPLHAHRHVDCYVRLPAHRTGFAAPTAPVYVTRLRVPRVYRTRFLPHCTTTAPPFAPPRFTHALPPRLLTRTRLGWLLPRFAFYHGSRAARTVTLRAHARLRFTVAHLRVTHTARSRGSYYHRMRLLRGYCCHVYVLLLPRDLDCVPTFCTFAVYAFTFGLRGLARGSVVTPDHTQRVHAPRLRARTVLACARSFWTLTLPVAGLHTHAWFAGTACTTAATGLVYAACMEHRFALYLVRGLVRCLVAPLLVPLFAFWLRATFPRCNIPFSYLLPTRLLVLRALPFWFTPRRVLQRGSGSVAPFALVVPLPIPVVRSRILPPSVYTHCYTLVRRTAEFFLLHRAVYAHAAPRIALRMDTVHAMVAAA